MTAPAPARRAGHRHTLESEAIHILREVAGQFDRPVVLFSAGKDSVVVLHLARKAFHLAPVPFVLLHVDTGHNFPEVLEFRDRAVAAAGTRLTVARSRNGSVTDGSPSDPMAPETPCRRLLW